MPKKVFITGGTGFVGSYLLRYLVKNADYQVKALKRKNSPMLLVKDIADQVEWIEGDVLDTISLEDAMIDTDLVIHSAAMISFQPGDFNKMDRINQEGTANVVNTALHSGIEKLIHISSIAALGRYKKILHYDENTKWERSPLNSQYAISKHMAEQEVWRGIAEGLKAAIINPSVIIGSGIWGSGTTTFFKQVWKGLRFHPAGSTGFVDVRDVARFAVELLKSDIIAERFVLNSENWTYKQLFEAIALEMGKNPPAFETGNLLNNIAWRGDWLLSKIMGKPRLITKEIATHISRQYSYGSEKVTSFFDYKFTPVQQTIRETCHQFIETQKSQSPAATLPLI